MGDRTGRPNTGVGSTRGAATSVYIRRDIGGLEMADPLVAGQVALGTSMEVAFGLGASVLTPGGSVDSFAPGNQGRYATLVREAEQLMRARQYVKALEVYRQVDFIGDKLPESRLGKVHANFALARYSSMTLNLAQALKLEPRLMSCGIRLRAFFSDSREFIDLRDRLVEQCSVNTADPQARLAMAYVLWLDGDRVSARKALDEAAELSRHPWLTEAIEAMRQSMADAEARLAGSASARPGELAGAADATNVPSAPVAGPAEQR